MRGRLDEIERNTGLKLDESTFRSVSSLNELGQDTVRRLADLSRFDQHIALRHLLAEESHGRVDAFLDAVADGADPATWGSGGLLVPSLAPEELLVASVREILERLGIDERTRVLRIDPDRRSWEWGQLATGAPAVELPPTADYRWRPPEGTVRMTPPHPPASPADDPRLTTLRWIASRIAFLRGRGLEPPAAELGADALIAIRALEREQELFGRDDEAVPGFLAPAEWYAGAS